MGDIPKASEVNNIAEDYGNALLGAQIMNMAKLGDKSLLINLTERKDFSSNISRIQNFILREKDSITKYLKYKGYKVKNYKEDSLRSDGHGHLISKEIEYFKISWDIEKEKKS